MEGDNWRRGRRHVRNDGEGKERVMRNNFERSPTKTGNSQRAGLFSFHLIQSVSLCHDWASFSRPALDQRRACVHFHAIISIFDTAPCKIPFLISWLILQVRETARATFDLKLKDKDNKVCELWVQQSSVELIYFWMRRSNVGMAVMCVNSVVVGACVSIMLKISRETI